MTWTWITLRTRSGAFVVRLKVPAFGLGPEVVVWGARTFVAHPSGDYREGFAYVVPPDAEAVGKEAGGL